MALRTWDSSNWKQALSPSITVGVADDDVGAGRKPLWICLVQTEDRPPVGTGLSGKQLLLSEDEAAALVGYLLESNLVVLDEETGRPVPGEP